MKTVAVLAVLVAAWSLAACVPAVVGGAAVGGYFVGKDEREPAVIATDGRITTAIKARLVADKYVDGLRVKVETYEGVVTLRGEVSSSLPREQAEKLAASVDGVKSVRNEIRIVRKPAE